MTGPVTAPVACISALNKAESRVQSVTMTIMPKTRIEPKVRRSQLGVKDQRIRIASKRMMDIVTAVTIKAAIIIIVVRSIQSSSPQCLRSIQKRDE